MKKARQKKKRYYSIYMKFYKRKDIVMEIRSMVVRDQRPEVERKGIAKETGGKK